MADVTNRHHHAPSQIRSQMRSQSRETRRKACWSITRWWFTHPCLDRPSLARSPGPSYTETSLAGLLPPRNTSAKASPLSPTLCPRQPRQHLPTPSDPLTERRVVRSPPRRDLTNLRRGGRLTQVYAPAREEAPGGRSADLGVDDVTDTGAGRLMQRLPPHPCACSRSLESIVIDVQRRRQDRTRPWSRFGLRRHQVR